MKLGHYKSIIVIIVSNGGREVHLEGEVDGGVEGPGDLDLRLAVAHPVVAEVELHVPRVGQPHHALHGGTAN